MTDEKKISIPFPLPNSPVKDAYEVQVKESTERWSEVTLEDGTVVRLKVALMGAARIEGEYDSQGNPAYSLKMMPQVMIVSALDQFKRQTKPTPVQ